MGYPPEITKGSIQYWPVKVVDVFKTLETLDGADLRFDVYPEGPNDEPDLLNPVEENASADNDGMYALPLVDASSLDEGMYLLYISFVASPQTPRLGPFRFKVIE